jgi:L-histidine N-alpha-methyltransferase
MRLNHAPLLLERTGTVDPMLDLRPHAGMDPEGVLAGLRQRPGALSPKYFYDDEGSRLFEEICRLPEYYPTRTETAILEECAGDIARLATPETGLIEYGSGASLKTRLLLDNLEPAYYMPVDISGAALHGAVNALAHRYPWLRIRPVVADYLSLEEFPFDEDAWAPAKRLLFFPGSTIGNLHPDEACELLSRMACVGGPRCDLIIGADFLKDPGLLVSAYDDAQGVTGAFNLNLLRRINRELGGDFPLDAFRHRAVFDPALSRVEMHLVARRSVIVHVAGETFAFEGGETLHTENSYKYTVEGFEALLRRAGFEPQGYWTDPREWFGVFHAQRIP